MTAPSPSEPASPAALLDAIRAGLCEDEAACSAAFDRLIEGFPAAELRDALRGRLGDLRGPYGEVLLRLVEAFGDAAIHRELAASLLGRPELPAERAWDALVVLQGSGLIDDYPELAERLDELDEVLEAGESSLDELVRQLEDGEDGLWIALGAFSDVEPEVREQILAELAARPPTPGLIEFFRLLCHSPEPATREAALAALEAQEDDHPLVRAAWEALAGHHPEPSAAGRARAALGTISETSADLAVAVPRPVDSLVTTLDRQGRGRVVLLAEQGGRWTVAAFVCDVLRGIVEVYGAHFDREDDAREMLAAQAPDLEGDALRGKSGLAAGLLAGGERLSGPDAPLALRYWLERTTGGMSNGQPLLSLGVDDASALDGDALEWSRVVLDACPWWYDDSSITYELAEELLLRDVDSGPDPVRDSGAYRYLFERRLLDRLELDRRTFWWMAAYWCAAGLPELAACATQLADELADDQHVVPGHPFLVELTTRSLAAAQERLRLGDGESQTRRLDGR